MKERKAGYGEGAGRDGMGWDGMVVYNSWIWELTEPFIVYDGQGLSFPFSFFYIFFRSTIAIAGFLRYTGRASQIQP